MTHTPDQRWFAILPVENKLAWPITLKPVDIKKYDCVETNQGGL
jgi:hypothetical protein